LVDVTAFFFGEEDFGDKGYVQGDYNDEEVCWQYREQ
jgi:hypothetical protein